LDKSHKTICNLLGSIEGPWSLIYWVAESQELWFGRDFLGRHSLLWNIKTNESLTLTSSGERSLDLKEVPAAGLFVAKFTEDNFSLKLFPWTNVNISDVLKKLEQTDSGVVEIDDEFVPHCNYSQSCQSIPADDDPFVTLVKRIGREVDPFDAPSFFKSLLSDITVKTRVEKLIEELKNSIDIRCNTQPPCCKNCVGIFF